LTDADVNGNKCASLQRGAQSRARLAVEALELAGPSRHVRNCEDTKKLSLVGATGKSACA
jgi:hypothetical protein